MPDYASQVKRWTEVTKLVAAGSWEGIRCPQNGDADLVIDKRLWVAAGDVADRRHEYWIHCPGCGAEIIFHSRDDYEPQLPESN